MALPPGFGTLYGDGWHDGTPAGQAAYQAYLNLRGQSKFEPLAPGAGPGYPFMPQPQLKPPSGGFGPSFPDPCDLAPGWAQPLCRAGIDWASDKLGGGNKTTSCPKGYKPDGKGGCQLEGMAPYIPGDVGRPDTGWTAVNGRYGAGVTPLPVQRVRRECPAGFVLGKDGVCYDRLARTQRAWDPGTKPLLTGGDVNALNRARQLQKRIGKLNTRFGPKKRSSCAPPRGRKR